VALLQELTKTSEIYRVWFLGGKVQTGVKTKIPLIERENFEGACACTENNDRSLYTPNAEIIRNIEAIAKKLQADVGSVEFFYDSLNQPIFFDVNMLSSLPKGGNPNFYG